MNAAFSANGAKINLCPNGTGKPTLKIKLYFAVVVYSSG